MTTTFLHGAARPRTARSRSGITAGAIVGVWALVLWTSQQVTPSDGVRDLALFVHLASLVAGMGAVLTVDWAGLHWLLGRRPLDDVLALTADAHLLIWLGLGGLPVSGCFLSPDLAALPTLAKLVAVLVVALNGVQAHSLLQELEGTSTPSRALMARVAMSAATSQACWWTAVVVGHLSSRSG